MNHLDGVERQPTLESSPASINQSSASRKQEQPSQRRPTVIAIPQATPTQLNDPTGDKVDADRFGHRNANPDSSGLSESSDASINADADYDDRKPQEIIHGRLVRGHIVEDGAPSPENSISEQGDQEDDHMTMSHASSFFVADRQSLGGSGDAVASSDEEDNVFEDPKTEHMITLVGDVRNRTVFIVDDMIDKPGSWIAAAETVVKKGHAKKVYCIGTHGVFGGDCLEQLQACDCIDTIVVTNSFPLDQERAKNTSKLVLLDLSFLLAEAIRRNHYGESISPLFQHYGD